MLIDEAMAEVVVSSSQPALGAIRLAWWREALERLDGAGPPPEPRLQQAAAELVARGISGAEMAELEDGWATLFEAEPDPDRIAQRGACLFALAARLIGGEEPLLADAGRLHALGQVARRRLVPAIDAASLLGQLGGHRFSRRVRPLTALARLAARDLRRTPAIEPEATPGRAAALLAHRLSGRVA